jgi:hypothetical protein
MKNERLDPFLHALQLSLTACQLDPPVLNLWDCSRRPEVLLPVAGPRCRFGLLTRRKLRPCPDALTPSVHWSRPFSPPPDLALTRGNMGWVEATSGRAGAGPTVRCLKVDTYLRRAVPAVLSDSLSSRQRVREVTRHQAAHRGRARWPRRVGYGRAPGPSGLQAPSTHRR